MPIDHGNSFSWSLKSHGKSLLKKSGHPGVCFGSCLVSDNTERDCQNWSLLVLHCVLWELYTVSCRRTRQQFLQSGYVYHFVSVNCLQCIWPAKTVPEMTYNVFSGTLNPTHFTSPSVLWRCWLGVRNSIQSVKIERWDPGMVICLEPGAYGPADATATPSSVDSLKSRLVQPFCCQLTQIVLERRPLNRCRVYSVDVYYDLHGTCRHLFLD